MLRSMRVMTQSNIFKALLILIVASFALWGVGDTLRNRSKEKPVVEIGPDSITRADLETNFRRDLMMLRQRTGETVNEDAARAQGLLDDTLERLINQSVLDLEADRLGLQAGQDVALLRLSRFGEMRNPDGTLNRPMFEQMLRNLGMSPQQFLSDELHDMTRALILTSVQYGLRAPESLTRMMYQAQNERRVMEVLLLDANAMSPPADPDAATLESYYKEHEDRFMRPEMRAIHVARLVSDDLAKDVKVNEEDIKTAYEGKADSASEPERRNILQVTATDQAQAERVSKAARAGGNLVAAALAEKLDAVPVQRAAEGDVPPELAPAAFSQSKGEISDVLPSPLGFHVLQVTEIIPSRRPTLEEMREEIVNSLKQEMASQKMDSVVAKLEDAAAAGKPFEETARQLGFRVMAAPAITAQGLGPDGKAVDGLGDIGLPVAESAFGLLQGQTSTAVDLPDGSVALVHVDSIATMSVPPLAEVKSKVVESWKETQKTQQARTRAMQLTESFRQGTPLDGFPAEPGLRKLTTQPLSAKDPIQDTGLSADVFARAFTLNVGQVTDGASPLGWALVRLKDIRPVSDAEANHSAQELREQVNRQLTESVLQQFLLELKHRQKILINTDVLKPLYGPASAS